MARAWLVSAATRRRPLTSTLIALLLLMVINLIMQANRPFLDYLSSGGFGLEQDLAKLDACESLSQHPDVFVMGSSRAEDGVDVSLVDRLARQQLGRTTTSCNLAMSGSTFLSDYYMLKRALEDGITPKLVVENLFEYNINANGGAETYQPAVYHASWLADLSDATAMGGRTDSRFARLAQTADFAAQKAIPLYGDRLGLFKVVCGGSTLGPCGTPVSGVSWSDREAFIANPDHGWWPQGGPTLADLSPAELQDGLANKWHYFHDQYLHDFKLLAGEPEDLVRLIALAQVHHVQVALVTSPINRLYFTYFDHPSVWPEIIAYWQAVARRHGVAYFDESHAPGYTDADFHDPHHLSVNGAEKFSTWLAITIVAPALR